MEKETLIVTDLHLGKAGHFRKFGVPIPKSVHKNDHDRLKYLIFEYQPKQIIILGDLFHSRYNDEWQDFEKFVRSHSNIEFVLVKGNHDILDDDYYEIFMKSQDELTLKPFLFTHKPMQASDDGLYNFSGHIHPSITLKGKGRQSLRLNCFYFGKNFAVLPSFGNFTGNYRVSISFGDLIYLIVDNLIVPYHDFVSGDSEPNFS